MFGKAFIRGPAILALAAGLFLTACNEPGDGLAAAERAEQGGEDDGVHDHSGHVYEGSDSCSRSGTSLSLVAEGSTFDRDCLAVPAGKPFKIDFTSKDTAGHNLVILGGGGSDEVVARTAVLTSPKKVTLNVSALPAGTYSFYCELHPLQMRGALVVR